MEDIIQLRPATNPFREGDNTARRDGTLLEKGVLLTEDFLIRNEKALQRYISEITAYPDVLVNSTL